MLFNGLICLYLMLTLVNLYRTWSSSPQLQNYVFPLIGCVFVMLACYHDAAFSANAGSRRAHTFFHLMAVYLCVASLPENDSPLFYLALAVWMLTGICSLTPANRRARPNVVVPAPGETAAAKPPVLDDIFSVLALDPVPPEESIPASETEPEAEPEAEVPGEAEQLSFDLDPAGDAPEE